MEFTEKARKGSGNVRKDSVVAILGPNNALFVTHSKIKCHQRHLFSRYLSADTKFQKMEGMTGLSDTGGAAHIN